MKLSVHLVTWNGAKYIPYLFDSLKNQTWKEFEIFILDNASTDGTFESIQKELENFPYEYTIIQNDENSGFATGHNRLYQESLNSSKQSEYIVCLNQDMYLEAECFDHLLKYMDAHPHVGSIAPRIMKWNFAPLDHGPNHSSPVIRGSDDKNNNLEVDFFLSDIIDSLGLKVFRSRRVTEQYAEERWETLQTQFSSSILEVFGVSGACPMYRISALRDISFLDGTFFDASYHSYKEDVDVSFRLQLAGYTSAVHLDAVVYHDRSAAGRRDTSDIASSKNKKLQSDWVKYHSYKNHLMTLYKNEIFKNLLLDFPFILWYELKKFVWFLLFDRKVFGGLTEIWYQRHELKDKRRFIQSKKKVTANDIRKWW